MFANDISDKGLISKLYKEISKLNIQKTIQVKKEQRTWVDISPKKTYWQPTDTWNDDHHHYHQGTANQNHRELLPHTGQNSYYQKKKKKKKGSETIVPSPHIGLVIMPLPAIQTEKSQYS